MNSGTFQNDGFSEVLGVLLPYTIYAFISLTGRIFEEFSTSEERKLQQILRLAGMRKTVDLYLEYLFLFVLLVTALPVLTWVGVTQIMFTTSFGFLFVNIIVYALNVILQTHLIRFTITNHAWAEAVEIFFEVAAIIVTVQGYFMATIEPAFVYTVSFVLPLSAITWCIKLGIIASNKNLEVMLGQANEIVNGNDMTTLLMYAFGSLLIKLVLILYMIPLKIGNNPEKPWGPFYLFSKDFWTTYFCSSDSQGAVGDDPAPENAVSEFASLHTETFLSAETSMNNDEFMNAELVNEKMTQLLTESECKMVEEGHYEQPSKQALKHGLNNAVQLKDISVEIGKKHVLHGFNMTAFSNEVLVLIGENGAGKSTVFETIAGLHHLHHGSVSGFGYDLVESLRYITTNFLSLSAQEEVLIDYLTPEAHIELFAMYMGLNNIDQLTQDTLWEYDLQDCANIVSYRMSKIQRKRLALALALLGDTKIVLLDEPTAGMDIASKRHIWQLIEQQKRKKCIIVAT